MKRLFVKGLLLITPFACVLAFVEYELRQLPNSYSATRAGLESRRGDLEVLITGSSHAQSGVRAELLTRPAFNLAYGSQSLHYDTELALKYAPVLPRLKLVIFTISYHALEYKLSNSIERWRAGFYQQVYGLPGEETRERLQLTNYSYTALYTPKEAYRRVLENFQSPGHASTGEPDVDAGAPRAGAPDLPTSTPGALAGAEVTDDFGKRRIILHQSEMHQSDIAENRTALERACHELRRRNIAVVFVTLPTDRTYYDHIDPATYQRMQQTMQEVSANCQCEYFNYLRDARFASADFLNSDHLNPTGAAKFSRIINEEILPKTLPPAVTRLDFSGMFSRLASGGAIFTSPYNIKNQVNVEHAILCRTTELRGSTSEYRRVASSQGGSNCAQLSLSCF